MRQDAKDRIREQMERYHSGDPAKKAEAVEEIVEEHQKFVKHVINQHYQTYKGAWYDDMFSAGIIGVLEALPTYDPDKGTPTTHFFQYINHEIYEFIAKFVNKTTTHYSLKIMEINRAKAELESVGIENPSVIDISVKSGIKPEIVIKSMEIQAATQEKSFQSEEFLNSLMVEAKMQPEEVVEINEGWETLSLALSELSYNQRETVMRKLGLGDYEQQSNEEISKAIGIVPSQVRRVFARAVEKLRKNSEVKVYFIDHSEADKGQPPISTAPDQTAANMITDIINHSE